MVPGSNTRTLHWLDGWQRFAAVHCKRNGILEKSDRYLYNHLSGYVYDAPGEKGEVVTDLVLGDLFEVESAVKGFLKIRIPDGRSGYVRKADCISFNDCLLYTSDA